jgi:hypothetical protein
MFGWLTKKLEERRKRMYEEYLLKRYGCVLYCYKCRAIIDQPVVRADPDRALYSYQCTCGACCTFDFSYPAPVKVSEELLSEEFLP